MNIGVIGSIYIAQLMRTAGQQPHDGTAAVPFFTAEPAGGAFTAALNLSRAGYGVLFCGRIGGRQPCPAPAVVSTTATSAAQITSSVPAEPALAAEIPASPPKCDAVCADPYGGSLRSYLANAGVNCTHLSADPHAATGIITLLKEENGTRRFVHDGANGRVSIPDVALFFEHTDSLAEPLAALVVLPFGLSPQTVDFAVREATNRRIPLFSENEHCQTAEPGTTGLPLSDEGDLLKTTENEAESHVGILPPDVRKKISATVRLAMLADAASLAEKSAAAQSGVGGDDSWGAAVHPEFKISGQNTRTFEFDIMGF